jgi:uncharacterized membrane protein (UPF0127 family)
MTFIKTKSASHPLRNRLLSVAATVLWATSLVCHAQQGEQPQQLPVIKLGAGMYNIMAQVAMSPEQRHVGLMYRKEMAVHEGMLFVFEEAGVQCFWMKNTLLPLSAAFVADDGTIVNIEDMAPQTEANHCSKRPVRFVLEMNQGWFAKRGLKAGAQLTGAPFNR